MVWKKSKRKVRVGDRISQFPDEVLVHILSFLPTVYSVQTTVLSKRWNNLWTSVPVLDFDPRHFRGWISFDNFSTFVDHALLLHNSSTVRKFRFHCPSQAYLQERDLSRIHDWICTVMRQRIGELDLCFNSGYVSPLNGKKFELELPRSVFLSKTLEVLKVDSDCITYPRTKLGSFPSLKFADVTSSHADNSSIGNLFINCPALRDLRIDGNLRGKDVKINICAPELRTLRTCFYVDDRTRIGSYIFVYAPKLENLRVSGNGSGLTNYILHNGKSLVRAKVDVAYYQTDLSQDYMQRATALLAGVSGVNYLSISGPNLFPCSIPAFNNLKQLKLLLVRCSYWEYVMELLKQTPKLEDLVLDINIRTWYDEEYVEGYEPFKPPEIVPICVLSHLKTISITNFMGHDDELDVVKYLLKYGEVLKKITISTSGCLLFKIRRMTKRKFQQEILKYQKCSKTCEIEVKFQTEGICSTTCSDCGSRIVYEDIPRVFENVASDDDDSLDGELLLDDDDDSLDGDLLLDDDDDSLDDLLLDDEEDVEE